MTVSADQGHDVSYRAAVLVWLRVAALSFGGPAGQIAVMHRILVEEKRWIGETRFLHALNYSMLLPGPEAHQLAIYIGWLLHRTRGGLVAGILFVLPGVVSLGVLSWIYASFGDVGVVRALFFGLKAAVLAVVLEAVVRVGRRALKSRGMVTIAGLAFVAIFLFAVPFPIIIVAAALIGVAGRAAGLEWFRAAGGHGVAGGGDAGAAAIDEAFARAIPAHVQRSAARALKVAVIGLAVWLAPLAILLIAFGPDDVFTAVSAFNSKMAVVTFGGAYAVLAYMAQQAVEHYHWLRPDEMLVGLGFAETTPGPLISVVQFVGFMAGYRDPGTFAPVLAGTVGGLLAAWATFVPSFIWIFLGGPYIEALRDNERLTAALSAVTAAVVGVILNLAIWLALHTIFFHLDESRMLGMRLEIPDPGTIDLPALVLAAGAIVAMFRFKLGMFWTFGACSVLGVLCHLMVGLPSAG